LYELQVVKVVGHKVNLKVMIDLVTRGKVKFS